MTVLEMDCDTVNRGIRNGAGLVLKSHNVI